MHIKQRLLLLFSHLTMLGAGFVAGLYMLPLLVASPAPSSHELAVVEDNAFFIADFSRSHPASDFLHWGEGRLYLSESAAGYKGTLSPAPDLVLYVSSAEIHTAADFERERAGMVALGRIRSFGNFLVPYNSVLDLSSMRSVIIWCDSFNQFITAASLTSL